MRRDEAELLRRLRSLGHRDRDHVDVASENARLDTLQAAILLVKLPHLDDWITARQHHAAAYEKALHPFFELSAVPEGSVPAHSAFVIRHEHRAELIAHLAHRGFDAKIHYPVPIHQQRAFDRIIRPQLPHTEALVRRIASLPVTPELDPADRDLLIDVLIDWSRGHA